MRPPGTAPAPCRLLTVRCSAATLASITSRWASAVGSGAAMNGPIGKPNAVVTGRDRAGVQGGVVGGSGLLVAGDEAADHVHMVEYRLVERLHEEGHTIILVTHERDIAEHADRTIHIRDGQVESDIRNAGG